MFFFNKSGSCNFYKAIKFLGDFVLRFLQLFVIVFKKTILLITVYIESFTLFFKVDLSFK